jgi:hypothetical protein
MSLALERRLTAMLRGRTEAPLGAEGAQSLSARGAKPEAPHGPLQRLLGGALRLRKELPQFRIVPPIGAIADAGQGKATCSDNSVAQIWQKMVKAKSYQHEDHWSH